MNIVNLMINYYNLDKIDFMGYTFTKNNATFHHLIVPNRLGGPRIIENGAILNGRTSHPYLHRIESVDLDVFNAITSEMIDINWKGYLDPFNLRNIDDILKSFEREHCSDLTKKGKLLIKEEYIHRVKM